MGADLGGYCLEKEWQAGEAKLTFAGSECSGNLGIKIFRDINADFIVDFLSNMPRSVLS